MNRYRFALTIDSPETIDIALANVWDILHGTVDEQIELTPRELMPFDDKAIERQVEICKAEIELIELFDNGELVMH